jgi:hypothetical protein
MREVIFDEYYTGTDWNMILNQRTISPPEPKTSYITVDGRDGDLDLSETLTGEIKYNNRTASYSFLLTEGTYSDREDLISEIIAKVHGKKLNIIDPDRSDLFLLGRCKITERSNNKAYGTLTIEANCEPYFYSKINTVRTISVSSETEIVLYNQGNKTACPEITVTGSITISYDNKSVALSDGTYKISDLKIKNGNNVFTVAGSGTIVFTYREGWL